MPHAKAPTSEIGDYADQWIKFFEFCEVRGITPGEACDAVREYEARHPKSLAERDPNQVELPLGSLTEPQGGSPQ
jgi:hypothetical protein